MDGLLILAIAVLFASGTYLLLDRHAIRWLFGIVLLGHGANLAIFVAGGAVRGRPPLVPKGELAPPAGAADPVPQALILTAIVIGFALVAFSGALVRRASLAAADEAAAGDAS